jgi:ParB family chromosome partitioning protein
MATKGLGKGLGALISAFDEENEAAGMGTGGGIFGGAQIPEKEVKAVKIAAVTSGEVPAAKGVTEIDVSAIDNNANQPRKEFDADKLQELAESIKTSGVIQPIILNAVGSRYMIVAGERRWRAAKIAGLKKIPAIVRSFTPAQIAEIAIVENLQRQDLNEIELARGIKKLIDEFNLTQEQAAVRIGKNRSAVAHTLRLLTLPAEIIQLVEQNKLTAGHARCLVTLQSKEEAVKLARLAIQNNLSVRELERLVYNKTAVTVPASERYKPQQSPELKEMARKMTSLFLTKVVIQGDNHKGKIVIDYFTAQDLMRIRKHTVDINELYEIDKTLKLSKK